MKREVTMAQFNGASTNRSDESENLESREIPNIFSGRKCLDEWFTDLPKQIISCWLDPIALEYCYRFFEPRSEPSSSEFDLLLSELVENVTSELKKVDVLTGLRKIIQFRGLYLSVNLIELELFAWLDDIRNGFYEHEFTGDSYTPSCVDRNTYRGVFGLAISLVGEKTTSYYSNLLEKKWNDGGRNLMGLF